MIARLLFGLALACFVAALWDLLGVHALWPLGLVLFVWAFGEAAHAEQRLRRQDAIEDDMRRRMFG